MKIINGERHYNTREVGLCVGRTYLTIHMWDKMSRDLEFFGMDRIIPKPLNLGKQKTRYWAESDIKKIGDFAKNIKNGDLAKLNRLMEEKKGLDS